MTRIFKHLDDHTIALTELAQPVIIALGSTGLTGGAMAAAGVLAGRMMHRR